MTKKLITFTLACLTIFGFSATGWSHPEGVNLIVSINGDVKVKRETWKTYQKANIGDFLRENDQIQLGTQASATLLCSNTEKWKPKPGKVFKLSEGCPTGTITSPPPNSPRIVSNIVHSGNPSVEFNSDRNPTRTSNDTIPYIISPRDTAILGDRPLLRWNAVPGTTRYTVQIQGSGLKWETQTEQTEIIYSGETPLKPGAYYYLTIKTDKNLSSEQEQGSNLDFTVLDEQKAQLVQLDITKIKQQQLNSDVEGLALAYLFQTYNLKAEAIDLLESLAKKGSQTTAIYRLLGDLYLQINLSQQAKEFYLKGLEIAKRSEDVAEQTEIQKGLGEAEQSVGNREQAVVWFNKAKEGYRVLGDETQIQELEQRISSLQKLS